MKKIWIEMKFIADTDNNVLEIDKLESTVKVYDNVTFNIKTSDYGKKDQLLTVIKTLLNQWDGKSRKVPLTKAQLNQLRTFFNSL